MQPHHANLPPGSRTAILFRMFFAGLFLLMISVSANAQATSSVNLKLRPQLWKQLKVGTRVVSHAFDMGNEWPPEKEEQVDGKTVYLWTITEENKRPVNAL